MARPRKKIFVAQDLWKKVPALLEAISQYESLSKSELKIPPQLYKMISEFSRIEEAYSQSRKLNETTEIVISEVINALAKHYKSIQDKDSEKENIRNWSGKNKKMLQSYFEVTASKIDAILSPRILELIGIKKTYYPKVLRDCDLDAGSIKALDGPEEAARKMVYQLVDHGMNKLLHLKAAYKVAPKPWVKIIETLIIEGFGYSSDTVNQISEILKSNQVIPIDSAERTQS